MQSVSAKSSFWGAQLAGIALLFGLIQGAAGEMPPGLEDALTSHGWSFEKGITHFHSDGTVTDGNGTARYDWDLDKTTGSVHLLERGPKSKDKARIQLWFYNDLTGFYWYDSHGGGRSGSGTRVDEAAPRQVAATGAPQKSAPLPDPPSTKLQAFSGSWLEKLLGPLDATPLPRAQLMQLQTDYQARLPLAAAQEKPTLQGALQVCTAFSNLMDAREKARTSLTNVQAVTSGSVGKKVGRKDAAVHDSAFVASGAVSSAMTQWKEQEKPWRDAIQQLLVRERQAELSPSGPK